MTDIYQPCKVSENYSCIECQCRIEHNCGLPEDVKEVNTDETICDCSIE